jgi:hypothetical protein
MSNKNIATKIFNKIYINFIALKIYRKIIFLFKIKKKLGKISKQGIIFKKLKMEVLEDIQLRLI